MHCAAGESPGSPSSDPADSAAGEPSVPQLFQEQTLLPWEGFLPPRRRGLEWKWSCSYRAHLRASFGGQEGAHHKCPPPPTPGPREACVSTVSGGDFPPRPGSRCACRRSRHPQGRRRRVPRSRQSRRSGSPVTSGYPHAGFPVLFYYMQSLFL